MSGSSSAEPAARRGAYVFAGLLFLAAACARGGHEAEAPALVARDLDGVERSVLGTAGSVAAVVLLVGVDCPISNNYAPEIGRLQDEFGPRGVSFVRLYCDPDVDVARIREHGEAYSLAMPALLDFEHALVRHVGAEVVPTAVLFAPDGEILYRGRIDDRFVDFGKQRAAPTRRDLRDALEAVLAGGRPAVGRTEAVGCFIGELVESR